LKGGFALRLIENPDTLREQVEQQARAERESRPWLRDAREAASARERLAKLETLEDNYRDQQAEGLIPMAKLREKLDELRTEREDLEARLALLADGESRLRVLEELPLLVEEYLRDLPYLLDHLPVIREYETVGAEAPRKTRSGSTHSPPTKSGPCPRKRLLGEGGPPRPRGARGSGSCMLCSAFGRTIHADGTLEITVGATGEATKGVMPCDEPGSPSTTFTLT
jgi:hypothetical protein